MIPPDVLAILDAVPAFAPGYLAAVAEADGDPGAPAAFTELAEVVAGLLARPDGGPALGRCLAAVESVAATPDGAELVAWAFLDSLGPDDRARLRPRCGARTVALLDEVEGRVEGRGGAGGEALPW
ncbi:MAG TPA: hypothetical protein VMB72_12075 [Acidimicrobiales bacterium]|nr:hypothetical protein [Acidimicrobiales bacterium]